MTSGGGAGGAAALFRQEFGRDPQVIAVAPGRVNLIGEHTDYSEGFVLPIAIERRTEVALARGAAPATRLRSREYPQPFEIEWSHPPEPRDGGGGAGRGGDGSGGRAPGARPAWVQYVLGPLRELIDSGIAIPALDIAVASNVPPGAGLSSSAALEVATAGAALALLGRVMAPMDLARLAQRAEHRFPGTPCGIMDMAISAGARAGHAMLLDCRTLEPRHVPLPSDAAVFVIDTGATHELSGGEYAARRREVEAAAALLGVRTLRDADVTMLSTLPPGGALQGAVLRRARHVISENGRALAAVRALETGDLAAFGMLMSASHASLRDDFEVSCRELDDAVAAAMKHGALGARLTGAGFGGAAIALLRRDGAGAAARAIADECARTWGRAPAWFITAAAGGMSVAPLLAEES